MRQRRSLQRILSMWVAVAFLLAGCTKNLIYDDVKVAKTGAHCSGSEGVDDSSIAVLPVPLVAFFVPHADLHEIKADDYLKRCGDPSKLVNREVTVNRTGCIPAGLTRIITLGIWQWCPAYISWKADVTNQG